MLFTRKLYNELTREKKQELNKAREEAKEIVDMALSESDVSFKAFINQLKTTCH